MGALPCAGRAHYFEKNVPGQMGRCLSRIKQDADRAAMLEATPKRRCAVSLFRIEHKYRVWEGRVFCPRSEVDKDLDACLTCRHLIEYTEARDGGTVRCEPHTRSWNLKPL